MAGVPITIPLPGEGAVASYSYNEISSGRGILDLYGIKFEDGTYALTSSVMYPTTPATTAGNNTAGDYDFDLTIVNPFEIRGDLIINVPFILWNGSGGSLSPSSDVTITVYEVTGSTETSIGSIGQTISGSYGGTSGGWFMVSGRIAVTSKVMKKDQKLRLNVVHTNPGTNCFVYLGHDPIGRSGTQQAVGSWTTTQLKIFVPQKLNL